MKSPIFLLSTAIILASTMAQAAESNFSADLDACNAAVLNGDNTKALPYAEKILAQDKTNRGALQCSGRAHAGLGQYDLALDELKAAEKLSVTPLEHMKGLTFIANALSSAQKYSEALAAYRQSLAITQAEKDSRFERINLNQIGDTLAISNQLDAALESYLAASKLGANDNERADSYGRIAAIYDDLGKHDQAIEYQIKATVLEERAGDLDHYANANLELGRIYISAKDYARAEKSINKIVQLSKEQGGAYWEAKSYYYLAQAKIAAGEPAAAKPLLADALRISQQIDEQPLSDAIKRAQVKLN